MIDLCSKTLIQCPVYITYREKEESKLSLVTK